MKTAAKYIAIYIIGIATALVLASLHQRQAEKTAATYVTDTITKRDTLTYYVPVTRDSIILRYIIDRLPIAQAEPDTLPAEATPDSAEVVIPITQKVYKDSTYTAYISGYRATLDSLAIYPQTRIITRTPKPKRWGLGVLAGAGATPEGIQPTVAVGVTYNLLQW